jgi:hypothetical protein
MFLPFVRDKKERRKKHQNGDTSPTHSAENGETNEFEMPQVNHVSISKPFLKKVLKDPALKALDICYIRDCSLFMGGGSCLRKWGAFNFSHSKRGVLKYSLSYGGGLLKF